MREAHFAYAREMKEDTKTAERCPSSAQGHHANQALSIRSILVIGLLGWSCAPSAQAKPADHPSCGDASAQWSRVLSLSVETIATRLIWGSAPNDVYLVGFDRAWHFDGAQWTQLKWRLEQLAAITGSGANDVYIANGSGSTQHFDGVKWAYSEPFLYVPRIFSASPSDLYEVGPGNVRHFEHGAQQSVEEKVSEIAVLTGSGPDDVFAAGRNVFHRSHNTWASVGDLKFDAPFSALSSVGPGAAVGMTEDRKVWRLDTLMAPEQLGDIPWHSGVDETKQFFSQASPRVWGASADEVFVTGGAGSDEIFRYDGQSWTPLTALPAHSDVLSVWGSGPGDVYVATQDALLHCAR